ncbi:unnamed protein product [Linum trigynum]|uniref:Uncharacterized protein n=1 Tax=Linum trigynum TaxID=586398 RepID=A0AAV2E6Q8_9ROSI
MVSCVEEASGETCAGVCREARAGFDGDPSGGVLGAIVVARIKCLHSYVETTSVRGVKKLMSITGWELFMLRMWPSHKVCSMKLLLLLIDTSPPRHLPISRLC